MSYIYKTTIEGIDGEVELTADLHWENSGIGWYQFGSATEFDAGQDYLELDDLSWDKTLYTEEQNKIIGEYIDKNMDELNTIIPEKAEDDYDPRNEDFDIPGPDTDYDNPADDYIYARGGYVSKGELVWLKLDASKRMEFLYENFTPEITPRSQELLVGKDYNFLPKNVKMILNSKYANVEEYSNGGGVEEYADGGRFTEKYFNRKVYKDYSEAKKELEAFLKMSEMKNEIFYDAIIKGVKGSNINQDITEYKVFLGNPYKRLWRVYFDTAITARNQYEAKEKLIKDKKWYEDRLGRFDMKYIGEVTKFNDGGGVGMAKGGELNYKAQNFLDTIRISDRSIQLKDITVDATPKGNWQVYNKGKSLMIVNGNLLDDETIDKYDLKHNEFAKGGGIPNMYRGKTAEKVWDSWTERQRKHFCYDHELMDNVSWKTLKMSSEQLKNDNWGKEFGGRTSWDWIKNVLQEHIEEGLYRHGGGIEDGYGDMNPEQIWNNWSSAQRYHFIYDHMKESTPRTQEDLSKKSYIFLPAKVKQELHEHIHMGKYKDGGKMRYVEYGDGGNVGTGKNAKALMKMDNDIWDKLNIDSGSQLYADEKLQKKYSEELSKGLKSMGYETYTLKTADILTDWNYHALRSAMTYMGYFGDNEKNNQLEYNKKTKEIGLTYYGLNSEIFTK
jgi:hypothetical protein